MTLRRMFTSLIFIIAGTWLGLSVLLYFFQNRFIFYPEKSIAYTPADTGLNYEDVYLMTSDKLKINGWYIRHGNPIATLLFLHGNGGNISHRLDSIKLFHELGLAVLIIDYRGYGLSEGRPSEKGTYQDAEAAWRYLIEEQHIAPDRIIIFGRSLGSAVATWLALQHTPGALILESAFTSVEEMGRRIYPYLPLKWLIRNRYPTVDRIADIKCPLLVIHSHQDEIIPFEFGQKIFTRANDPKQFLEINGGHNDGFLVTREYYLSGIDRFLSRYYHKGEREDLSPFP